MHWQVTVYVGVGPSESSGTQRAWPGGGGADQGQEPGPPGGGEPHRCPPPSRRARLPSITVRMQTPELQSEWGGGSVVLRSDQHTLDTWVGFSLRSGPEIVERFGSSLQPVTTRMERLEGWCDWRGRRGAQRASGGGGCQGSRFRVTVTRAASPAEGWGRAHADIPSGELRLSPSCSVAAPVLTATASGSPGGQAATAGAGTGRGAGRLPAAEAGGGRGPDPGQPAGPASREPAAAPGRAAAGSRGSSGGPQAC